MGRKSVDLFLNGKNIGVLGAGSWGTTLAVMLSERHNVKLWEFDKKQCEKLKNERENKKFLPGIKIPEKIFISNDIEEVLYSSEIVLFVTPSHTIRTTARKIKKSLKDKIIVSASKGLEERNLKRMSEVLFEETGNKNIFVISGPSHAEEVSRRHPTTVVISSFNRDQKGMEYLQRIFITKYFRVYTNEDIIGVELGGALKNIIAIASGISDGMGFGSNTKAALMTRGIVEIQRLGVRLGAQKETFAGLAGIGDLITTCISAYSRNRYVGEQLGKGKKLKDILKNMTMVAEGVKTTKAAYSLAKKFNVNMPITEEVYKILYKNKSAKEAVLSLMMREPKPEIWGI